MEIFLFFNKFIKIVKVLNIKLQLKFKVKVQFNKNNKILYLFHTTLVINIIGNKYYLTVIYLNKIMIVKVIEICTNELFLLIINFKYELIP